MDEVKKGKFLWRWLALAGGVAVLAWAMREKLISIEAPREEIPPTFRTRD